MAKTKQAATAKNFGDSRPKYLGVKLSDGEVAGAGNVLIRQRGMKYRPGRNVRLGRDDTLYAARTGVVRFQKKNIRRFDGNSRRATIVRIDPAA